MTDEDLANLIAILARVPPSAKVAMPGAMCSADEMHVALLQAQMWRLEQHLDGAAVEILARAVLLFFDPGPWTSDRRTGWRLLTGSEEATNKVLCDLARRMIAHPVEQ